MIRVLIEIRGDGQKSQQNFKDYINKCILDYPKTSTAKTWNITNPKSPRPHWLYTKSFMIFDEQS